MREIKFRLIKDNKIVGFEEHRLVDDGMGNRNMFIYHSRTGHIMSWKEITICPEEYLKHDDKNQFTGLHDKNGKEIYEDDILDAGFCDIAIPKLDDYQNMCHIAVNAKNWEIIGNRWKNPELLEDK